MYVTNSTGSINNVLMQQSNVWSALLPANTRPCFLMVPLGEDSIKSLQASYDPLHKHLVTEPVQASVLYYSIHRGTELKVVFPAVATFLRSTEPQCRALNIEK